MSKIQDKGIFSSSTLLIAGELEQKRGIQIYYLDPVREKQTLPDSVKKKLWQEAGIVL